MTLAVFCLPRSAAEAPQGGPRTQDDLEQITDFLQMNCLDCHNTAEAERDLDLETFVATAESTLHTDRAPVGGDINVWETILKRLKGRQMPPPDAYRPDESAYAAVVAALQRRLDRHAETHPPSYNPSDLRRLTRTEYGYAIEDLLDLQVDATRWLPADSSSHGFDNITVGDLSPTRMERYLTAAQQISRLAVGGRRSLRCSGGRNHSRPR